jgi:hypothetical protein
LVYIGRTYDSFKKRLKGRWVIEGGSDQNNVKIYLGKIFSDHKVISREEEKKQIEKAEAILINALTPAFNSSNIQSVKKEIGDSDFVLYNEGNYRSLYPILESSYYWANYKNYNVTDSLSKLYKSSIENKDNYYGFFIEGALKNNEKIDLWIGVDYLIWNEKNIPLILEIVLEENDEKLIKKIKNLQKDINLTISDDIDGEKMYFVGLDNDFIDMEIEDQKKYLNTLIAKIDKGL